MPESEEKAAYNEKINFCGSLKASVALELQKNSEDMSCLSNSLHMSLHPAAYWYSIFTIVSLIITDDEVMIMAKKISQTARLRLSFKNSNDAKNFFAALGRFAKCKENGPPAAQTDPVSERVEDILSTPAPLPQAWNTEWPTQSLEGLVRLCLSDPNFPGFVRRVDSIMKKLTSKATSLD
ncbi:hypothetical protein CLF_111038 [Clonorchis sinensis]|uniref:Uncharacterized protein n=1 Tax=Clonorchis sinensis TaxID=79923 RepID=G7YU85_CLOSI|nr:hypothetical protein CLF_111038 [Clonorchis sinensis]